MRYKRCSHCIEFKGFNEFYADARASDGRQSRCKKCHAIGTNSWAKNNPEKRKKILTLSAKRNRGTRREYERERLKNPTIKLLCNLRKRVSVLLRGKNKSAKTLDLIGCSAEQFKEWIEAQFESWMNWDNYGTGWEIDHIKPCSAFDLAHTGDQRACFNFSNCQPLSLGVNRSKRDKWNELDWRSKPKILATP